MPNEPHPIDLDTNRYVNAKWFYHLVHAFSTQKSCRLYVTQNTVLSNNAGVSLL